MRVIHAGTILMSYSKVAIGSASEFKAWIMVLLLSLAEQISNYREEADGARMHKCSV
ncbi:hypothetical protein [Peribacillus muralis]|uniref:hypothetical protein n=1 Tax=Peribacillus muralis TaxID=264697 RepID=UPI003CFFE4B0